jgi:hypothetical protein
MKIAIPTELVIEKDQNIPKQKVAIDQVQIGDLVERLPHHFEGKYISSIHTAKVERLSIDGMWVRALTPASELYHISRLAFDRGWWKLSINVVNLENGSRSSHR